MARLGGLHRGAALSDAFGFAVRHDLGCRVAPCVLGTTDFSCLRSNLSPSNPTTWRSSFSRWLLWRAGSWRGRPALAIRAILGAAFIGSSLLLAAMEEQTTRSLTANGPTAIAFATAHSGTPVFGAETVERQSVLDRQMHGSFEPGVILPLSDLQKLPASDGPPDEIVAYAIDDPQAAYWAAARSSRKAAGPNPRCVQPGAR